MKFQFIDTLLNMFDEGFWTEEEFASALSQYEYLRLNFNYQFDGSLKARAAYTCNPEATNRTIDFNNLPHFKLYREFLYTKYGNDWADHLKPGDPW